MANILEVHAPFDGSKISEVEVTDHETIEQRLMTARRLADMPSGRLSVQERRRILEHFAQLVEEHQESLAIEAAREGGKPLKDSRTEVQRAITGIRWAAEELPRLVGRGIPMNIDTRSAGRFAFTTWEPIGVVFAISAFNHPVNLIVHQVVPAIAMGCPVLVKPASSTPLSCLRLIQLLREAGLPPAWCEPIICNGETAEGLAARREINFLNFIGSERVGWKLRSQLAPGTRCALEHGGVAPVILAADADLEAAVPALTKAAFYHAGQVCVSLQRMYVHREREEELLDLLKEQTEQLLLGDPTSPDTDVGPLISHQELQRVDSWVHETCSAGGELVCGGSSLSASLYTPTIISDVPEHVALSREEIFGPVVGVYRFTELETAVAQANATEYAFQAAVFTESIDTATFVSQRLNAAAVMVNDHTAFRVDWMPFGGHERAGLGTGGIPETMREVGREKLVVLRSSEL